MDILRIVGAIFHVWKELQRERGKIRMYPPALGWRLRYQYDIHRSMSFSSSISISTVDVEQLGG